MSEVSAINGGKVAILGAGRVGAATAFRIALERLCGELVLADLEPDKARAEAVDLQDAACAAGSPTRVRAGSYYDCADAALCILCVSARREDAQPGRLDQAAAVVGRVIPSLMATGFQGVILVLSQPVELMTWLVQQLSDLPDSQVLGVGAVLDAARLRLHIGEALGVPPGEVYVPVLGIHNGEQVVPWGEVRVRGEPLSERPPSLEGGALFNTIAELNYLLREVKGTATFGAAAATAEVSRALLTDSGAVLSVCAPLRGEYGAFDLYASVPAVLGARGVRRVVECPLSHSEQAQFSKIVRTLEQHIKELS